MRRLALLSVVLMSGLAVAERAKPRDPPPPPPSEPMPPHAGAAFAPRPRRPTPAPNLPVVAAPAEVGKLGKDLAGSYKCKGVTLHADGSSEPMQATLVFKLDLDNAWLQLSLVEEGKAAGFGIKWVEYRTFDETAKQWTRIQVANTTGHVIATSLGEKAGKWLWEGTATSPRGTMQLRDYEQRDGKQLKLWGEALLAGSWQKLYEATCKK